MKHFNYILLIIAISLSTKSFADNISELSDKQLHTIGQKIYHNETGSNPEYLIAWNTGEAFASLGLGHFIWFPEGTDSRFTETFPSLLHYMQSKDVDIPAWLQKQKHCPWQTKEDFINAKNSKKMQDLRHLLISTFEHQLRFIQQRMRQSLPLMLATLDSPESKILVAGRFEALTANDLGMYSLIDYVNFKGEGTSETEKYNNQGWGLLQVLLNMQDDADNPHMAFSRSCDAILTRRVENSPQRDVEKNWLAGWRRRCATYNDVNTLE
ncbi:MAG: hypothetical protein ACI9O6_002110 [Glaciecola sp.]|jgi:hypothetical protein